MSRTTSTTWYAKLSTDIWLDQQKMETFQFNDSQTLAPCAWQNRTPTRILFSALRQFLSIFVFFFMGISGTIHRIVVLPTGSRKGCLLCITIMYSPPYLSLKYPNLSVLLTTYEDLYSLLLRYLFPNYLGLQVNCWVDSRRDQCLIARRTINSGLLSSD
jgi:hypothetical protein